MSVLGVNITHIVINEHGGIFAELIELLSDVIARLGYSVEVNTNRLVAGRLNVVVGHTAFLSSQAFRSIRAVAAPYVVFQVEALSDEVGFAPRHPAYLEFLKTALQIWDYSPTNQSFLAQRGCQDVRHIPIGYAASLERFTPAAAREIDVLFYGATTPRRQRVLEGLRAREVCTEVLFGAYGAARDRQIARAKLILNIHQFNTAHLEEIRMAHLLNNRCFVVSEVSDRDPYGGGVVFCDYDRLVDSCVHFLAPAMQGERERIARVGYEALKGIPMMETIRSALSDCGDQ